MTKFKYRATVAVRASKRAAANTFWSRHIDQGGGPTFTQGLSTTGQAPATWYWASMVLEEWQLRKLAEVADANPLDCRIVLWPRARGLRRGTVAKIREYCDGQSYITIAESERSSQSFLDAVGFQVVRQA